MDDPDRLTRHRQELEQTAPLLDLKSRTQWGTPGRDRPPRGWAFQREDAQFHVNFVLAKPSGFFPSLYFARQQCFEAAFPLWMPGELAEGAPLLISTAMQILNDLFADTQLGSDRIAYFLGFLFRCFLIGVVDVGREVLTPAIWKSIKDGEMTDGQIEDHLKCRFIEVEELEEHTVLHVRLPERAARVIAESHHYPLQLDPHVTPFEINKRYGGVDIKEISSGNVDSNVELRMEKEKQKRTRFRRWKKKWLGWLLVGEEANQFVPPFVGYNSQVDTPPGCFFGLKTIGRMFARYDREGKMVIKAAPFTRKENLQYTLFRQIDRHRLLYLALHEVLCFESLVACGVLETWHPAHDDKKLADLMKNWASFKCIAIFNQPINDIRNYFGEEIAMYFAFLMQLVDSLKTPALLGVLLYCVGIYSHRSLQFGNRWLNYCELFYCLFIMAWSTHFNQKWNRFESRQRAVWGLAPFESLGSYNPTDPLEQNFRFEESAAHRLRRIEYRRKANQFRNVVFYVKPTDTFRQLFRLTTSIAITVLATVLAVVLLIVDVPDFLLSHLGYAEERSIWRFVNGHVRQFGSERGWDETKTLQQTANVFAILASITVKLLDHGWDKLVFPLTKYENHQTISRFKDWASTKLFVFKFSVHFCPLLYLAFFKGNISPCLDSPDGRCVFDLRQQLVALFTVDVVVRMGTTFGKLVVKNYGRGACKHDASARSFQDAFRVPYEGVKGIIGDYMEVTTLIGMVALFSVLVPALPFLALCVALVEVRSDAIKVATMHQRPFPVRAGMIRAWQDAMGAMALATIVTNGHMLAFETVGYQWPTTVKLFCFVGVVVMGLTVKELVHIVYPNVGKKEGLLRARMHEVFHDALWGPRIETHGQVVHDWYPCASGAVATVPGLVKEAPYSQEDDTKRYITIPTNRGVEMVLL